jgi:hypothetical protein
MQKYVKSYLLEKSEYTYRRHQNILNNNRHKNALVKKKFNFKGSNFRAKKVYIKSMLSHFFFSLFIFLFSDTPL